MSKRELIFNAFDNKETERVPVGFWFHFADQNKEVFQGLENPAVLKTNIEGHQKFFDDFDPDFLKLMSDGFFGYPSQELAEAKTSADLRKMKPLGADHPWITEQVKLVSELTGRFKDKVASFYNLFAPLAFVRIFLEVHGKSILTFYLEGKEDVAYALDVVAEDLAVLAGEVIKSGGADGIYLSVQNLQIPTVTKEEYLKYIGPSEQKVLAAANEASEYNILHVCGYEGSRNDLTVYEKYDAKVINWAVTVEGVSLEKGRKIFGHRAVIGGFDNRPGSLLHAGRKEEIQAYTKQLIAEAGWTGIIIGADCTVPADIEIERLKWVRDAAKEVS